MKSIKLLKYILIIAALYVVSAGFVLAHDQETNDGVSAVLHIDPNDWPIAEEPASFYITFKNIDNDFDLEKCDCVSKIFKDDVEIVHTITESSRGFQFTSKPVLTATLQNSGAYKFEFEGKPKDGANFKPVKFTHDFNVNRKGTINKEAGHHNSFAAHIGHYIIFGGAIIIVIVQIVREKLKDKSKKVAGDVK